MTNDVSRRLACNAELNRYLAQLTELAGREVTEAELGAPEDALRLRKAAAKLQGLPKRVLELAPEEIRQARFGDFVRRLVDGNPSPVSIWLNAASACGMVFLPRVDEFNFRFRFSAVPEGVVALLTEQGMDKLLLDFGPDEVVLELQGNLWGNLNF
jgi:hypothetical protein